MIFKRNVLALALASVGFCATSAAYAAAPQSDQATNPQTTDQDAPATQDASTQADAKSRAAKAKAKELQTVQVSGFVSSIENSTALKRNASSIVEAVSAEQIGKLPGVSIADTLGRLPGLAVQTVSGRPQVLTIHGLGPDFSTALVNGGQQVSTSNNRDVQFDQYPSSWFDNVVVHLTPQANLIGQGLTGTVDMHTIRPLEKNGPEAAVNAHYIWDGHVAAGRRSGRQRQGLQPQRRVGEPVRQPHPRRHPGRGHRIQPVADPAPGTVGLSATMPTATP